MKKKDQKNNKQTKTTDIRNAVQQARPNTDPATIKKPATQNEVKDAVLEINPDMNTLDRG